MDWWLASFFLGAIFSLFLPIVPEFFTLFLFILISIILFYFSSNFIKLNEAIKLNSGLIFGACWMLINAAIFQQSWQNNNINVIDLSAKAQWVKGKILSLHTPYNINEADNKRKDISDNRSRFNILVSHINENKLHKKVKLRLSWKNASLSLQQGQSVSLKVKLKPPHGLANLGGFNYKTWLNSKSIQATGYVIKHKRNQLLNGDITLRQRLFNDYKNLLPKNEISPLLLALGFGSRAELNQNLWQVLTATGTGHLIAISGLHIGLVASGTFVVVMLLVRVFPLSLFARSYRVQTINIRYFAIGLSIIVAISYGYLAGFSLPTVRALVMLVFYWSIRLLKINISIKRWLLLTLFVITISTPFSLFSASFWLSFYAVIIIFLTLWRFKNYLLKGHKAWRFIKSLVTIQVSLTIFLLPISAIFFKQVPIVALLANIIAVPWMSLLSIPFCLLSVLSTLLSEVLASFLIVITLESLQILWSYLVYLSTMSWAVVELSFFNIQLIVVGGLASFVFIFLQPFAMLNLKRGGLLIIFTSILILALLVKDQNHKQPNNWQLVIFDVGQGLSVLIQRNNQAILYDTGASYESGFNMIEAVVLPYLQHENIKKLNKVIISHSDNDHAGGLALLNQSIDIDELIYNSPKEAESKPCLQGDSTNWQGITIDVLWPDTNVFKENDDSCVILLNDGKHSVLLTGDISKKVERKLIKQYPQLKTDVLIVPHHGSKTSSSHDFIASLNPQLAIVSSGFLNRWNMPVAEVLKRYQKQDVELMNTAKSGQIILKFTDKGIEKFSYHDNLWPFWFAK